MHNSPLVRTLQLLRQDEMDTLYLFVQSPIFNTVRHEETRALFEYLKNHYPLFQETILDREIAGRQLFPKSKDPLTPLYRTMTQLMGIVRKFITFQHWTAMEEPAAKQKDGNVSVLLNDSRQRLALLRFYSERLHQQKAPIPVAPLPASDSDSNRRERRSENFFLNLYQQTQKEVEKQNSFRHFQEIEFTDFNYYRYLLHQEKSFYENLEENYSSDQNILSTMEQLDEFYLLNKLDLMCRLLHQQRLADLYDPDSDEARRLQTNRDITRELVRALTERQYLQKPAIRFYCLMVDYLTQEDKEEADRLSMEISDWLQQNDDVLPDTRTNDCKIMLRSFWTGRYRETKNRRFLERIYMIQLDQLREIGPRGLPCSQFQNIFFTALKLGKVDWAASFFEEFKDRIINTQQQEMVVTILQAALFFYQKKYDLAAKTLPHYLHYSDLDDVYLYAITATLDARLRYEMDALDDDYSTSMLRTTSTHIRRDDTMPVHVREQRVRFFSLITALDKLRQQQLRRENIQAGLAKIRKRLDQEVVVDWEWLEEKYAALAAIPPKTENR